MTKDEQDALVFLSTTHRAIHKNRIESNSQTVIRAIAFYALSVAARFAPGATIPDSCTFKVLVWAFFLCLAGFSLWEFYTSGIANEWNHTAAKNAEDAIIKDLQAKGLFKIPKPVQPRRYAWLWRSAIVVLSSIAAAYVITYP